MKTVNFPYDKEFNSNILSSLNNVNEIKVKYGNDIDEKKKKQKKEQTKAKDITQYDRNNDGFVELTDVEVILITELSSSAFL